MNKLSGPPVTENGQKFLEILELLYDEISAIRRMTPVYNRVTNQVFKTADNQISHFVNTYAEEVVEVDSGIVSFKVPSQYIDAYSPMRKAYEDSEMFRTLFPKMALVALVTVFDNALASILKNVLNARPELIDSKEALTLREIKNTNSIQDAIDLVIDRIIDSTLRESHAEQIKWLERKLSCDFSTEACLYPQFIEVTERRNIYTHTRGVVNQQYLNTCKNAGYDTANLVVGSTLQMSDTYFMQACNSLMLFGAFIAYHLWIKSIPDDKAGAFHAMNVIGLEALTEDNNEMASVLYDVMNRNYSNRYGSEEKLMIQINLAQSYKWLVREQECLRVLNSIEWSALSGRYQLARLVLIDDYDGCCKLIRTIHPLNEVTQDDYRTWPLFRNLRKEIQFQDLFHELYGVPLKEEVRFRRGDEAAV